MGRVNAGQPGTAPVITCGSYTASGTCGEPATELLLIPRMDDDGWSVLPRCGTHPAEEVADSLLTIGGKRQYVIVPLSAADKDGA